MERLRERLAVARRALETLFEVMREPKTAITRDSSIKRFEYTYEAAWKAAQTTEDTEGTEKTLKIKAFSACSVTSVVKSKMKIC